MLEVFTFNNQKMVGFLQFDPPQIPEFPTF